jgi:c-src tyrosine kinase
MPYPYINPNMLQQYQANYSNSQYRAMQQHSYPPPYNSYGANYTNGNNSLRYSNGANSVSALGRSSQSNIPTTSPSFKGQSISRLWQIHPSELDFGTSPIVLGSGTFGVVHLAKYRGDMVAVKIPKIGIEDFQKEKDILLSLRHRNIVLCQGEVFLLNGQQGIVLEYMANGTLKDFIEKNHRIPADKKINLAMGIAKGLAFLHGEAIFHRDLSHNNVLIDDMGTAKITDFGKAKPISHVLGTSGTIGTYLWMPPEAFKGAYTQNSDIFSFGILMWEMETGNTNPGPPSNADVTQDPTTHVITWRKKWRNSRFKRRWYIS